MTLFNLLAALACGGFVLASAPEPAPTAPPSPPNHLGPRFLQEAHTLPPRGLYNDGVLTIPLRKRRAPNGSAKAKRHSIVQVPTSDIVDILYAVAVDIGGEQINLSLDSGSSDLWSATSSCQTPDGQSCNGNNTANHGYTPSNTFQPNNLSFMVEFGPHNELPTFVSGTIGTDTVTFGDLSLSKQVFGLATAANISVVELYDGILGTGAPSLSSNMFAEIAHQLGNNLSSIDGASYLSTYFSAVDKFGPLLHRLASSGKIAQPMYTVSLQREEPTSEGSNAGVLTLGGLPPGIPHDSLIWVPVQRYPSAIALFRTFDLLNVTVPSSLVDEVSKLLPQFTYRWQIPIDGMSVNGHLLPNSSGIPGSQLSALFDTGTSQLLIPPNNFNSPLLPPVDSNGHLPCSTRYNISFSISGKQFGINPDDLLEVVDNNNITTCASGLAEGPMPLNSSSFNFILGNAFFRSAMVAFYFGNETDPDNQPLIGLLSTTNISRAESTFSSFWQSAETATPSFTFSTTDGIPILTTTSVANPINSNAGVPAASGGV